MDNIQEPIKGYGVLHWHTLQKEREGDSRMNDVQNVILDIYKTVLKICQRNNIKFYAIGGTCIGAVRHSGFIPWDDDLDIAVPIQDYDRFWKIMRSELPEHLSVYTCNEIREFGCIFGKIHNIHTSFIENINLYSPKAYKGIMMDVMPIASIPEDKTTQKAFYRKLFIYDRLNYVFRFPFRGMDSVKKKISWILTRPFVAILGYSYFSKKWISLLEAYPLGSTNTTGYTWCAKDTETLRFPIKDFSDTVWLDFEDTKISCPIGYDDYLTRQFGTYMELPPEDKRIQHPVYVVDTKKSFKEYQMEKQI